MTEAEWNRSADPLRMVDELPPAAPRRKLVLFAVGCCRQFEADLNRPSALRMLEAAEQFADGALGATALKGAIDTAAVELSTGHNPSKGRNHPDRPGLAAVALLCAVTGRSPDVQGTGWPGSTRPVRAAVREVLNHLAHRRDQRKSLFSYDDAKSRVLDCVAILFRDVVGPLADSPTMNPAWLTSDVRALARGIYDDRAFDRIPILADALQDAGCDDGRILTHCRDAKLVHARGCWLVELLRPT